MQYRGDMRGARPQEADLRYVLHIILMANPILLVFHTCLHRVYLCACQSGSGDATRRTESHRGNGDSEQGNYCLSLTPPMLILT